MLSCHCLRRYVELVRRHIGIVPQPQQDPRTAIEVQLDLGHVYFLCVREAAGVGKANEGHGTWQPFAMI